MVPDTVLSRHIPVDSILRSHRRENLTFKMGLNFGVFEVKIEDFRN